MLKTVFGHEAHHGRCANTVIGTKRGVIGCNPFPIHHHADRVGIEIVGRSGIGLRNHVHMGLQNDHLAVFKSCRCRDGYNKVSAAIAEMCSPLVVGHLFQKLQDSFFLV